VPIRDCSSIGVLIPPKLSSLVIYTKHSNPVFSPQVIGAGKLRGILLEMLDREVGRSECHSVVEWIQVLNLPDSKESRRPTGVSLRENL
jgi:hypothetical protein